MVEKVPIYDNHIHMSPSGRNIDAIQEFEAAGGTGFTLVNLPYKEVHIREAMDFVKAFEITYEMASLVREHTSLDINVAVGPYPILLLGLAEEHGIQKAKEVMIEGMEIAGTAVAEGKAQAIGEVGRPHFDVSEEIWDASNEILLEGMRIAAENDCPMIIHSEAGTIETNRSLSEMASKAGLDRGMVVKHSSPPFVTYEENFGIMPSIPASRNLIREAISKGSDRFMLETDYYDDPEKPGARMSVNTVPKRIKAMLANGEISEENVFRIGEDIPKRLFRHR
ncbi:MAG TPA: TatD family hydrolase [Candidatus Methanomethylophilaceae archaeon]|nr:TatD family hydrolase [Candidatus Methanomethylophilaceae archaeon]